MLSAGALWFSGFGQALTRAMDHRERASWWRALFMLREASLLLSRHGMRAV